MSAKLIWSPIRKDVSWVADSRRAKAALPRSASRASSERLILITDLEAGHSDIRLVAILLPKKPLLHLRPVKAISRDQARSFRKMENDGVWLRERAVIAEPYNRHLPRRIHGQESGGPALAVENIDFSPLIGYSKEFSCPLYFEAIPRDGISKYLQHSCNFPNRAAASFEGRYAQFGVAAL